MYNRQREKSKQTDGSPLALFNMFIDRVRQQMHIVLAMSPIGDAFRNRLRKFPSLVNCCTIDWFQVSVGYHSIYHAWVIYNNWYNTLCVVSHLRLKRNMVNVRNYWCVKASLFASCICTHFEFGVRYWRGIKMDTLWWVGHKGFHIQAHSLLNH